MVKGDKNITKSLQENKNQLYPVFLKLDKLETLLVGAGNVGLEKLQSLLPNSPGAKITIVAPQIKEGVKQLLENYPSYTLVQRMFEESDLDGKDLVILATGDDRLHRYIKQLAEDRGILTNVADDPALCDFYLGSIVQKGSVKIAISTNGKSPTIAKRLKEVLQQSIPDEISDVTDQLNAIRTKLKGNFSQKVKKLNALTKVLTEKDNIGRERRWKKIATFILMGFALMLLGHFIFSYLEASKISDAAVEAYRSLDKSLLLVVLAGFLAQLVDGFKG